MREHLIPDTGGFSAAEAFRTFAAETLVFAYRGAMNDSITEAILGISENTLEEHTDLAASNRKVSFLIVECFQNILRHGIGPSNDAGLESSTFTFRSYEDAFYINSINAIHESDRIRLVQTVDRVNDLDREGLTELYRKQLSDAVLSDRGGAGLGLIELARKSGRPIHYHFEQDGDQTLFHNQVSFRKSRAPEYDLTTQTSSLKKHLNTENVLMLYKGDLAQRSILPLLDMAELNTELRQGGAYARKVGHVLIEMLQNISRHSQAYDGRRDGVMLVGTNNERFIIQTCNKVNAAQRNQLQAQLDEITELDYEGLRQLHKTKFKASIDREDKRSSGLGLVQIARDGRGCIDYRFEESDNDDYFFTLAVSV